jgi:hypothetical protein
LSQRVNRAWRVSAGVRVRSGLAGANSQQTVCANAASSGFPAATRTAFPSAVRSTSLPTVCRDRDSDTDRSERETATQRETERQRDRERELRDTETQRHRQGDRGSET